MVSSCAMMDYALLMRLLFCFHFLMVIQFNSAVKEDHDNNQDYVFQALSFVMVLVHVMLPEFLKINNREMYEQWTGDTLAMYTFVVALLQCAVAVGYFCVDPNDPHRIVQICVMIGFSFCVGMFMLVWVIGMLTRQ